MILIVDFFYNIKKPKMLSLIIVVLIAKAIQIIKSPLLSTVVLNNQNNGEIPSTTNHTIPLQTKRKSYIKPLILHRMYWHNYRPR